MNSTVKAVLVVLAAILAAYGTAMAAGVTDWHAMTGSMASAAAGSILGLFTNMPQRAWSDEERAAKLGAPDATKP